MQTRHRICVPHQGPRRGHIQGMLNALIKLSRRKALKICTLAPINIINLNVIARFDKIALSRRRMNANICKRIGQRIRQFKLHSLFDNGAFDHYHQGRCRVLSLEIHNPAGGCDHHTALLRHAQLHLSFRWRQTIKKSNSGNGGKIHTARIQAHPNRP